jgi:hypothetical protein
VHGHDQCAQFRGTEVLDLVDQDGHRHAPLRRSFAYRHEQVGQVHFQVAAVGRARIGLDVEADVEIADRDIVESLLESVLLTGLVGLVIGGRSPADIGDDLERATRHLLRPAAAS